MAKISLFTQTAHNSLPEYTTDGEYVQESSLALADSLDTLETRSMDSPDIPDDSVQNVEKESRAHFWHITPAIEKPKSFMKEAAHRVSDLLFRARDVYRNKQKESWIRHKKEVQNNIQKEILLIQKYMNQSNVSLNFFAQEQDSILYDISLLEQRKMKIDMDLENAQKEIQSIITPFPDESMLGGFLARQANYLRNRQKIKQLHEKTRALKKERKSINKEIRNNKKTFSEKLENSLPELRVQREGLHQSILRISEMIRTTSQMAPKFLPSNYISDSMREEQNNYRKLHEEMLFFQKNVGIMEQLERFHDPQDALMALSEFTGQDSAQKIMDFVRNKDFHIIWQLRVNETSEMLNRFENDTHYYDSLSVLMNIQETLKIMENRSVYRLQILIDDIVEYQRGGKDENLFVRIQQEMKYFMEYFQDKMIHKEISLEEDRVQDETAMTYDPEKEDVETFESKELLTRTGEKTLDKHLTDVFYFDDMQMSHKEELFQEEFFTLDHRIRQVFTFDILQQGSRVINLEESFPNHYEKIDFIKMSILSWFCRNFCSPFPQRQLLRFDDSREGELVVTFAPLEIPQGGMVGVNSESISSYEEADMSEEREVFSPPLIETFFLKPKFESNTLRCIKKMEGGEKNILVFEVKEGAQIITPERIFKENERFVIQFPKTEMLIPFMSLQWFKHSYMKDPYVAQFFQKIHFDEKFLEGGESIFHHAAIMEYVEGENVAEKLEKDTKKGPIYTTAFMIQLLKSLEGIHKIGLDHDDLKPENIMISNDKYIRIIDPGLGKHFQLVGDPDQIVFTPGYTPPEKLIYEDRTEFDIGAGDVYSAGALFFEMLTGKKYANYVLERYNVWAKSYNKSVSSDEMVQVLATNETSDDFRAVAMALAQAPMIFDQIDIEIYEDAFIAKKIPEDIRPIIDGMLRMDAHSRLKTSEVLPLLMEAFEKRHSVQTKRVNNEKDKANTLATIYQLLGQFEDHSIPFTKELLPSVPLSQQKIDEEGLKKLSLFELRKIGQALASQVDTYIVKPRNRLVWNVIELIRRAEKRGKNIKHIITGISLETPQKDLMNQSIPDLEKLKILLQHEDIDRLHESLKELFSSLFHEEKKAILYAVFLIVTIPEDFNPLESLEGAFDERFDEFRKNHSYEEVEEFHRNMKGAMDHVITRIKNRQIEDIQVLTQQLPRTDLLKKYIREELHIESIDEGLETHTLSEVMDIRKKIEEWKGERVEAKSISA